METTIDGLLVVDPNREIAAHNQRFVEMWGIPDGLAGADKDEQLLEWVADNKVANPGAFRDTVEELYDNPRETSRDEILLRDGRVFDRYSAPVVGDDGTFFGRLWVFRDITDRKTRERELERQDFLFERVQDIASIGVWEYDLATETLTWSDGIRDIHGVADGYEPTLEDAIEFYHPEDRDDIRAAVTAAIEDGQWYDLELRIGRPDGDVRDVRARGEAVVDEAGDTELVRGVFQDVTERKTRERELERERAFTDQMVDTLEDVFYVVDPDGELLRWNDRLREVTGYTDEELAEMRAVEFFPLEEHHRIGEGIERALSTGESTTESRLLTADGEEIPHEFTGARLTDPDGDLVGIVGVGRDVSERREREQQLERQNERLAAFANLVSHDLRNPLTVAQGRLEVLDEEYDSEHIDAIGRAHDRMEAIIDDILTLAREGERVEDTEPVALTRIAERTWETVDTRNATLHTETDRRLSADRSRLQRLLENLVRNAIEHAGDDVTVTVGDVDDGSGFYVADDGPGIPPEKRDQVFESGYSSSRDGTGFGLSIVSEIAAAHGWDVAVTESRDGGARFELTGVEWLGDG